MLKYLNLLLISKVKNNIKLNFPRYYIIYLFWRRLLKKQSRTIEGNHGIEAGKLYLELYLFPFKRWLYNVAGLKTPSEIQFEKDFAIIKENVNKKFDSAQHIIKQKEKRQAKRDNKEIIKNTNKRRKKRNGNRR